MVSKASSDNKKQMVAVTSTGSSVDSTPDPRFGRCAYFVIFRGSTDKFESVKNEGAMLANGAGIRAAQQLIDKGVMAVITQQMGNNAMRVLSEAGIKVYYAKGETCSDLFEKYVKGDLAEAVEATVPGHHGFGGWGAGRHGGWR